jgi:hypothetical protein
MVSQKAVFSLVFYSAQCFIPTEELTEEQLEKLDNITIHPCDCTFCRHNKWMAHARPYKAEISWSRQFWRDLISGKITKPIALIEAVGTVLHEIIHILFPEYNEKEVREKTCQWLKRNLWLETFAKFENLPKSELEKIGYKF